MLYLLFSLLLFFVLLDDLQAVFLKSPSIPPPTYTHTDRWEQKQRPDVTLHQWIKNYAHMFDCRDMAWTNRWIILGQFLPFTHLLVQQLKFPKAITLPTELLCFYNSVPSIMFGCKDMT